MFGFPKSKQLQGDLAEFMTELNSKMLDDELIRLEFQIRLNS